MTADFFSPFPLSILLLFFHLSPFFFFLSTTCHSLGSSSNRMCLNTSGDDANRSSNHSPQPQSTPSLSFSRFHCSIVKLVLIWLVLLVLDLRLLRKRQGLHPDLRSTGRAHLCVNGCWNGDVGAEGAAAQRQNCPAAPLVSSGSVWSDWLSQTG